MGNYGVHAMKRRTVVCIACLVVFAATNLFGCSQPAQTPAPPAQTTANAAAPPAPVEPAPAPTGPRTYALSPETTILWVASVPVGARQGGWTLFEGTIDVDGGDFETAKISVEIDMNSAFSDAAELTEKLKGEENFFNPVKFPKATFKSTSVKKTDSGYDVTGDLAIRDKTKSIVLPVTELAIDGKSLTCKSNVVINRQDFGVTYQSAILDYTIKDTADLSLEVIAEAK